MSSKPIAAHTSSSTVDLFNLREVLAGLNLSDPHCNIGAIDLGYLPYRPPPLTGVACPLRSDSSVSSVGTASSHSSSEMDTPLKESGLPPGGDLFTYVMPPREAATSLTSVTTGKEDCHGYKTALCQYWQRKETCPFREHCEFAHGPKELRTPLENEAVVNQLARLASRVSKPPKVPTKSARQPTKHKSSPVVSHLTVSEPPAPLRNITAIRSMAVPHSPWHILTGPLVTTSARPPPSTAPAGHLYNVIRNNGTVGEPRLKA